MAKRIEISEKEFKKLYEEDKLNTFQIAKKFGCCQATIWKKLEKFNITPRLPGVERVNLSKKRLYDLYINKKLSTWKIEKILNIPRGTIHRKLKKHGIEIRDLATANIKYKKVNFSGDLIEKSYLIGFRIGDLGVRKQYPNSKTICVASGSTIPEQINLIKNLFNDYGRIWIKKTKNNKTNIQIFLNESFNFLLTKEVSDWIFKKEDYFLSFLAGFIDAEGNIGIYNNMARFSLGNYDFKLLKLISLNLTKCGINFPKLIFDKRKGKSNSEGYVYKNNYCSLRLHNKDELFKLLLKIKPFIKHKKKIKALNNAIENINNRNKFKNYKKMRKTFYITTTIPYANAFPHIGFALEIIQADVLARWNKINNKEVFFLTGTDEHGVKNYQTAKKQGMDTQEFVDKNSNEFRKLTKVLNISNNYFIKTTDKKNHWPGVIKIWETLRKKGDIYKKKYTGSYCSGCERFITEKDLINRKCPNHPNLKIEKISEENYFFKLSKYSDKIKQLIKEDKLKIIPEKWKNDFLSLIKDGLTDVSFSRDKEHLPWGIPVPGDKNQVMYVWPDALSNYLTGIGFPDKKFEKYWPADIHIVGKDMLRFHTGIWPGMLLSANLPLPKKVIVHGFLTVNNQKMSKSLGNVISPISLSEKYSADALRYTLIRSIPFGDDGDFSEKVLIDQNNNELANKLGNLVSRVTALAEKYGIQKTENKLLKKFKLKEIEKLIENYELDKALNEIFTFIDICNEYVQTNKIWETKDKEKLYELIDSIKAIAILLWPFIPETSEKIASQFKFKINFNEIKKPIAVKKIKKSEILFKKR